MINSERQFKQLKDILEEKKTALSEAKGRFDALKQRAVEEFGTHEIADLNKLEKKYKKQLDELANLQYLNEEKLDNLLEELGE
jgi:hypothetical protein